MVCILNFENDRQHPAPTWRSIDTAPKNGVRILLKCLNGTGAESIGPSHFVTIGQWTKPDSFAVSEPDWYCDSGYWLDPDGWSPLPGV